MGSSTLSLALPLALAGAVLGCKHKDAEIRIGASASLTGDTAALGQSNRMGYEFAVADWNAKGGVLGKRVRLVIADDKGDPAEGATVATKLIERDRVAGLLGATLSKVSLASAPIAQAARVPMITPTSTHAKVTATGDYIFRVCFLDAFQGQVGARFAFQDLHARNAACLFDLGNDYTKGLAETFSAAFRDQGGQIRGFEGHASGATDFKAQLSKLIQAKVDLLYLPDYYADAALIARQARDLGYKGPLLGGDGWDSPRLVELGGRALEPGFFTAHYAKDDPRPEIRSFVARFQARYGSAPDSLAVLAYDAANVLLEALQRAGTSDPEALRRAIAATDREAVSGRIRFDAQRNPIKPVALLELRAGQAVYRTTVAP